MQLQFVLSCYQNLSVSVYRNQTVIAMNRPNLDAYSICRNAQTDIILSFVLSQSQQFQFKVANENSVFPQTIELTEDMLTLRPTNGFLSVQRQISNVRRIDFFASNILQFSQEPDAVLALENLDDPKSAKNFGQIIGIIIGVLLLITFAVLVTAFRLKRDKALQNIQFTFDKFEPVDTVEDALQMSYQFNSCNFFFKKKSDSFEPVKTPENVFSASQVPSIPKQYTINSQSTSKPSEQLQLSNIASQQKLPTIKMQPSVTYLNDVPKQMQNMSIQNPSIQVKSQPLQQQQSYQVQQQTIIPTFPEIQQSRQPIEYKYQLPQQQLGSTDYKYQLPGSTQQYNSQLQLNLNQQFNNNNQEAAQNEQGQQGTHKKVVRKVRRKVHIEKKTDEQSDSNTQAAAGAEQ
ncbi:Hypothetical_protein [Hexamita inflata]|uniref:Hypothetical_protein n=1 Tax=Hexamita inflata TaxID=28002 RepID=A0AA86Q8D6_9EUKA|nr:Hypothetical protein HINF_LOCUS38603 [Hexamita inflata]